MECVDQKQQLRKVALNIRQSLTTDVDFTLKSTSAIGRQLLGIPEVQKALTGSSSQSSKDSQQVIFASYAPAKGEANPNGFLDQLVKAGRARPHMAFPRISGKGVLSLHFAVLEELLPGSFGIPEPGADLPLAQLADIAVMLIPGVAFDHKGNRLGYGKGYYDRLLAMEKGASGNGPLPLLIGISYDETLFAEIPTDPHDKTMDYVVTPTRIIHSTPSS